MMGRKGEEGKVEKKNEEMAKNSIFMIFGG